MRDNTVRTSLCLLLFFAACTPAKDPCESAADGLVADIQAYVDKYSDVTPAEFAEGKSPPSDDSIARAIAKYRKEVSAAGCDSALMRQSLVDGLADLRGEGVIAQTLATTLRVTLSSAATFGNAQLSPQTINVEAGRDLAETLASAIPGSTLRLGPGEFKMSTPLIVLDSVTLIGAGKEKTRIISTSPGAAIIFLGNRDFTLEDITLEHQGEEDASLLVLRGGSFTIRNSRVVGARTSEEGVGGIGLVAGSNVTGAKVRRMMRIEDTEFIDNTRGGILIDGDGTITISAVRIQGSGVCGICFKGSSNGAVIASEISSNAIGVILSDSAKPRLENNTFSDNRVAVLVSDDATPTMLGNRYVKSREAALVFSDQGAGSTTGDVCEDSPLGIILLQRSAPSVESSSCPVHDLRAVGLSDAVS